MLKIESGRKITLDFVLRDKDKNLLDKTSDEEKLIFIYDEEVLIKPLNEALRGKKVGDSFRLEVPPKDAYGHFNENLINEINIDDLDVSSPYEGLEFEANTGKGLKIFTIKHIDNETNKVVIDGNHPYAGLTLVFEVKIINID